jgi:hypothetical protein
MSDEMKELLTACNKLKVGSTANVDTIILELANGKERTQMKTQLTNNRRYITQGVLQMENRDKGTSFAKCDRSSAILSFHRRCETAPKTPVTYSPICPGIVMLAIVCAILAPIVSASDESS